jgi:hypothetical protein
VRLDGALEELAANSLELLSDVNFLVLKVDVLPAEPQHLTSAKPIEQQQQEGRVEWASPNDAEKLSSFLGRPGVHFAALPLWKLYQAGNITT